jgi:hypothetical protein
MKNRIINNWKTTLIGLVILLVGIVALFLEKITGLEFIGIITTSLPLIVAKDSLLEGLSIGIIKPPKEPK